MEQHKHTFYFMWRSHYHDGIGHWICRKGMYCAWSFRWWQVWHLFGHRVVLTKIVSDKC